MGLTAYEKAQIKTLYETQSIRNIKTPEWVITQDHLEGRKRTDIDELKKQGYTVHFKLYDDDSELYYSGYYKPEIYDEFEPLDWAMGDSGCTFMKVRNPQTGKYEVL